MPQMEQINDDELNNEDGGEDNDKKPDTAAQLQSSIDQLARTVKGLNRPITTQAEGKEKQGELSQFEQLLQTMLANGAKVDDLRPFVELHVASQNDLKKQMEKMVAEGAGKVTKDTLDKECRNRAEEAMDAVVNIERPAYRQAFLQEMWEKMADQENDDFATARNTYNDGRAPSKKEFEKVARLVSQSAPANFVKTKTDTKSGNPQLDTGNSRPSPNKAINKDGSVDLSKCTEVERDIYVATLNHTKSKTLALKALKEVAPLYQS